MEWIDVKDKLPKPTGGRIFPADSTTVLAYRSHPVCCIGLEHYEHDIKRWSDDDRYDGQITHWMPLPEPPEEEQ